MYILNREHPYMELQWKFTFVFSHSKQLKRFAQVTGTSESELLSLLYLPTPTSPHSSYPTEFNFYGAFLNRSIIRPHWLKVCPKCLAERGYCLRVWDCSLVTACPVHSCMLIDMCPRCESHVRCIRNSLSVCSCGCDWRETTPELVTEEETTLPRQVYQLCGLLQGQTVRAEKSPKNPLYTLDLRDLAIVITFIAGLYGDISWATGSPSKSIKWLNKDLHNLYARTFSVFENWPNNFYRFLSEQSAGEGKHIPHNGKLDTALKREFSSFYEGLYKRMPESRYDFLRNGFVEFLAARLNPNSAYSFRARFDSADQKYISVSEARRILRVNHQSLVELIKAGEIEYIIRHENEGLLYLVNLSDIKKIESSFTQTLSRPTIDKDLDQPLKGERRY